ncbi:MAG TPA: glycosyltransferase [Bryobacteraceae bacterium]|nr:glycosyltransferase [Bryobacteraceae bacterium]
MLVFVSTYIPGYKAGGPIRSIENLVAAFGDEFRFRIVTLDRDLGDKVPFPGIVVNRWVQVGRADVMYFRPDIRGLRDLWMLLRSIDRSTVLYTHSLFNRRFSMLAVLMCRLKLSRPRCVMIAPHGEFSSGALNFKRIRKLLYIRISRQLGFYRNTIWHACSDFEARDIARQFPLAQRNDIAGVIHDPRLNPTRPETVLAMAPDIAGAVSVGSSDRVIKKPGNLQVIFVGRCSRMKNLSGALTMLAGLSGDVFFNIYGPVEDAEYWKQCQDIIAALPPNIRVKYEGEIAHEKVSQFFAAHHLFLLPTLGEGYGHVIGEALASGCPVLISDQTPWRNLDAEGVGWDIPLSDEERFRSALQQCVDGDAEWFAQLSTRAVNYAVRRASDPKIIDANRNLFQLAFALPGSYKY